MNTIRSTWYGWGSLCVAGGGAYWFAKRQINADRQSRLEEELRRKELQRRMEAAEARSREPIAKRPKKQKAVTSGDTGVTESKTEDHAGSPSAESSQDVAPVSHAPGSERDKIVEKSKYEAAEPYRSRKGDRFS